MIHTNSIEKCKALAQVIDKRFLVHRRKTEQDKNLTTQPFYIRLVLLMPRVFCNGVGVIAHLQTEWEIPHYHLLCLWCSKAL